MDQTLTWKDGARWQAEESDFQRVLGRLERVGEVVWGLEELRVRWQQAAQKNPSVGIDELAPSEDERAVLTAGLERALEDTRAEGPKGSGFEDPMDFKRYVDKLEELHRLVMTDVTYTSPGTG